MTRYYQLDIFYFSITISDGCILPDNLKQFAVNEPEKNRLDSFYFYDIHIAEDLPDPSGIVIFQDKTVIVLDNNGLEERYIGSKLGTGYYAHYRELDDNHAEVTFLSSVVPDFRYAVVFLGPLALEKHVLNHGGIVLHCSYIKYKEKAILFSAPSGTGKSTQASLWEQHRGAKTINGDRALLTQKDGIWMACGWPICGTSDICFNETIPIHSIAMISQANKNQVQELPTRHAWTQIYSQLTINRWNTKALEKAIGLLEQLIIKVPVYHLACNISEQAVLCLEQMILPDIEKSQ